MAARASVHVYVTSGDGAKGAWLKPGDEVPEWAQVDARNVQGGDVAAESEPGSGGGVQAPPRAGKGSGLEAWLAFAEAHAVDVDSGMSRDDVIAACEAAEVA